MKKYYKEKVLNKIKELNKYGIDLNTYLENKEHIMKFPSESIRILFSENLKNFVLEEKIYGNITSKDWDEWVEKVATIHCNNSEFWEDLGFLNGQKFYKKYS